MYRWFWWRTKCRRGITARGSCIWRITKTYLYNFDPLLTSTHNLYTEIWKLELSENFQFLVVKFSIYLNRRFRNGDRAEKRRDQKKTKKNQRTDSPKSLLACKVLMECCVSSMHFYTIHAKKIDDIPMLPILYDKMELYGIYQASGHCTSWIEDFL